MTIKGKYKEKLGTSNKAITEYNISMIYIYS